MLLNSRNRVQLRGELCWNACIYLIGFRRLAIHNNLLGFDNCIDRCHHWRVCVAAPLLKAFEISKANSKATIKCIISFVGNDS